MAVRIRLQRFGSAHNAFYRIVAAESTKSRDGKFLALLGTYNPLNGKIEVDQAEINRWYRNGALPTDTVRTILKKNKIFLTKEVTVEVNKEAPKKAKKTTKEPVAKSATSVKTTSKKEEKKK